METILATNEGQSTENMEALMEAMFIGGDTFSSGNGEEIAVEPLESALDARDENCKNCQ